MSTTKIENAKTLPKVYFGLHMVEGVAEYPGNDQPFRIFINEDTIKKMDPSFQGRPVYVKHVDHVDLDNIQQDADGYVTRSFFNALDGKHWVEFIVVSDKGHEAISKGWKLSNAYIPKTLIGGGLWHGVSYEKEIIEGEYEHLAIVPNPRYEESIILTPEQFKEYNNGKESALKKLANSKDKETKKMKFNFFKKIKVENAVDLEETMVTLPKCGQEMTIAQVINEADQMKMEKNDEMARPDHKVVLHDGSVCNVAELIAKHKELNDSFESFKKESEAKHEEKESPAEEKKEEGKKEDEISAEEVKEKAIEIEKHEEKEIAEEKKHNAYFDDLKSAPDQIIKNEKLELSDDQVARGKARYGSGK